MLPIVFPTVPRGDFHDEENFCGPRDLPGARTGVLVGRAISTLAALCDLRLAVIGGSLALGFGAPFFDAAQNEATLRARLGNIQGLTVVPAGLASSAPLVGAAALVRARLA